MRRTVLLLLAGLALAVPARAQMQASGKAHCVKPEPGYTIEVPDKAGHTLGLRKAQCTWSDATPVAGLTMKTGTEVGTNEVNGMTERHSGYHTAVMDNGDKVVVHFAGTSMIAKDAPATIEGKWTYVSGTGKVRGIKGGGTYKGTGNADGSSEVSVEGTYSLPNKTTTPAATSKK